MVGFNCLPVVVLQKYLVQSQILCDGVRTCFVSKTEVEEERSKISKNIYTVEQIARDLLGQD